MHISTQKTEPPLIDEQLGKSINFRQKIKVNFTLEPSLRVQFFSSSEICLLSLSKVTVEIMSTTGLALKSEEQNKSAVDKGL